MTKILQQPQRARACGSGAKSSADRRPVDPPPVVQLRIFDGDADITFGHMASFFLYTTLEPARTIAPMRGAIVPQQTPVLTGTPVAGMAYLDRPDHAGYFIFPDLSVRHEGRYRLSFNLFEEVKREEDEDAEATLQKDLLPNSDLLIRSPSNPFQLVHFRLEVKSEPFTVFSAKKFPGLTESTTLSRTVAEQGCRVRIRRDVRIRVRKDTKPNHDAPSPIAGYPVSDSQWNEPVDHAALDRARSSSNGSALSHAHQYPNLESRMTQHEPQYIKPSPYTTPTTIPKQQPYQYSAGLSTSNLGYNSAPQSYQPPALPAAYNYPSYHQQQQQQTIPQHRPHSRQNSSSSLAQEYSRPLQPQQQQHYQPQHQMYPSPYTTTTTTTQGQDNSYVVEIDNRQQITNPPAPPPPRYTFPQSIPRTTTPISMNNNNNNNNTSNNSASGSNLPSIKALQPLLASSPTSYDSPISSLPLSTISSGIPVAVAAPPPPPPPQTAPTKTKRGYSTVFHDAQSSGSASAYGSSRTETAGEELSMIETEEYGMISEVDISAMKNMLQYRRADGTRHLKQIPGSQIM